jgi:hypothetical protein
VIRDVYAHAGQSDGVAWDCRGQPVPGGYCVSDNVRIWRFREPPLECLTGPLDCLPFPLDATEHLASAWETYRPGINSDPTLGSTGWGAECSFAIAYQARYPGRCLDIYKDTPGNTPLCPSEGADWSAYSVNEGGISTKRFPLMVYRLSMALNAIQIQDRRIPRLGGLIWDGCQSDALSATAAAEIEDELPALIGSVRDIFHSHVRLIVCQVHPDAAAHVDPEKYPVVYTDEVREALEAVVSRDPLAALIDVDDQAINLGHVVPAGIFIKGQRAFAADQALQGF